jgi:hypothetical protein
MRCDQDIDDEHELQWPGLQTISGKILHTLTSRLTGLRNVLDELDLEMGISRSRRREEEEEAVVNAFKQLGAYDGVCFVFEESKSPY